MLSINISELVLTIISFFILLFLLNKFLFTPVSKFMAERQARLDASLEKEREASGEVAENEQRIEERQNAKARVDAMAKDARAQLDSEKDELTKTLAERLMG